MTPGRGGDQEGLGLGAGHWEFDYAPAIDGQCRLDLVGLFFVCLFREGAGWEGEPGGNVKQV